MNQMYPNSTFPVFGDVCGNSVTLLFRVVISRGKGQRKRVLQHRSTRNKNTVGGSDTADLKVRIYDIYLRNKM